MRQRLHQTPQSRHKPGPTGPPADRPNNGSRLSSGLRSSDRISRAIGGVETAEHEPALFIRRNTAIAHPPLLPEIALHLATEVTPLWQATEETMARGALPPPFWAFAWAGGQALARYLLDHPDMVAGREVFDFGSGSGLVAIAAAHAGAARVTAADTDPFAAAAIALNAAQNGVTVTMTTADPTGGPAHTDAVVTAGDVCYEMPMASRAIAWLRACAGCGSLVLLGDPGRTYLPASGLVERARYIVPTSREIEDRDSRDTRVWQFVTEEGGLSGAQ